MKIKILLFLLLINLSMNFCQKNNKTEINTKAQSNMKTTGELIFSKELDKETTVECYVNSDDNYFYWEYIIKNKGKENKTINHFKINKLKLKEYSQYPNRSNFYKQFRIISVFKNSDELIFLIDKFGQVEVQIYSTSEKTIAVTIPVKRYEFFPMDIVLLGEDFQDVKMVDNTIYTLSVLMGGGPSIYYISKIDINNKKVMEGSVNVSTDDFVTNPNNVTKPIAQLEDGNYKENGSGFKFSLFNNNQIKIEENRAKPFVKKIDFKPPHIDRNEDVNKIIEHLP